MTTQISTGGGFGHPRGCQCPFCLSNAPEAPAGIELFVEGEPAVERVANILNSAGFENRFYPSDDGQYVEYTDEFGVFYEIDCADGSYIGVRAPHPHDCFVEEYGLGGWEAAASKLPGVVAKVKNMAHDADAFSREAKAHGLDVGYGGTIEGVDGVLGDFQYADDETYGRKASLTYTLDHCSYAIDEDGLVYKEGKGLDDFESRAILREVASQVRAKDPEMLVALVGATKARRDREKAPGYDRASEVGADRPA